MSSTRPTIRMMCVLLAAVIAFCAVPSTLLALGIQSDEYPLPQTETLQSDTTGVNENTPETNANNLQTSQVTRKDPQILFEIESNRTANSKQFQMSDGTVLEAHYPIDVHYIDSHGTWQNIDNTLAQSRDNGVYYAATRNGLNFAPDTTASWLLSIAENNYIISFKPEGATALLGGQLGTQRVQSVNAVITNTLGSQNATEKAAIGSSQGTQNSIPKTTQEDWTTLENLTSYVTYANIYPNVDLRYTLYGTSVYKELTLKKATAISSSYAFSMQLDGLYPTMTDEGGILLLDRESKMPVYEIPAPYMKDSAGAYSYDVQYTLSAGTQRNTWNISIEPNTTWLASSDRVYPVTITPTLRLPGLTLQTPQTYISSGAPSTSYANPEIMYVGNYSSEESEQIEYRAYWKYLAAPTNLPLGRTIQSATLTLRAELDAGEHGIGLYMVESSWTYNGLTWNKMINGEQGTIANAPFSGLIKNVPYNQSVNTKFEFDVTKAFQEWASGKANYGICLRTLDESFHENNLVGFYTLSHSSSNLKPIVTIVYNDIKGIEDHYSTSNFDVGNSGTAYVNHATGDLHIGLPLVSTGEALFEHIPALLFSTSDSINSKTNTPAYLGQGWIASWDQTITPETSGGTTIYRYRDGDGTPHLFIPQTDDYGNIISDTYLAQDGLLLELRLEYKSGYTIAGYTLTDNVNTLHFDANGILTSFTDDSDNMLLFNRSNGILTNIAVQPAGQTASQRILFTYDSSGLLTEIRSPYTNQYVKCIYSTSSTNGKTQLSTVQFYLNDTTYAFSASYTYDSAGKITSICDTPSQYQIHFTYTTSLSKVESVTEKTVDAQGNLIEGNKISFTYEDGRTILRTRGSDDIYGNDDDLKQVYVIDNKGRPISTYTTNLQETEVYNAQGIAYDKNNAPTNAVSQTFSFFGGCENLLKNGNLDGSNIDGWLLSSGVSIATLPEPTALHSVNVQSYDGAKALLMDVANVSTKMTATQNVALTAETTYTLSAYIHADSGQEDADLDALVWMEVYQGQELVAKSIPLDRSTLHTAYSCFIPMTVTFTPELTGTYTCAMVVQRAENATTIDPDAYVLFDTIILHEGKSLTSYNYLENGGFEETSNTMTYPYWNIAGSTFSPTQNQTLQGTHALAISGCWNQSSYAIQEVHGIHRNEAGSQIFVVSGWGRSTNNMVGVTSHMGLTIVVRYTTNQEETFRFSFDTRIETWQYIQGVCITDKTKTVAKVFVKCEYTNQIGTAFFDNISLCRGDDAMVQNYEYNGKGRIKSVTDGTGNGTEVIYETDNNMPSSIASSDGQTIDITYASNEAEESTSKPEQLVYDTDGDGIPDMIAKYSYNSFGQATATQLVRMDSEDTSSMGGIYTSVIYEEDVTSNFGYVTAETDDSGNTTYYSYANGRLCSLTFADGLGITYSYDYAGRLTNITPTYNSATYTEKAINYAYDTRGRLQTITTPTTYYTMSYDAFGNIISISCADRVLATYEYAQNNGKLLSVTYANGYAERCTYDELNRLAKMYYVVVEPGDDDTTISPEQTQILLYEHSYDDKGQLMERIDYMAQQKTVYEYSALGVLLRETVIDTSANTFTVLASFCITQDDLQRVNGEYSYLTSKDNIPDRAYGYVYTYGNVNNGINTNLLASAILKTNRDGSRNQRYTYTYDVYERLANVSMTTPSNIVIDKEYEYEIRVVNGVTYDTTRVDSVTTTFDGADEYYLYCSYNYDEAGRITSIGYGDLGHISYQYDATGQLIRENNSVTGYTYLYTYDDGGNMISRRKLFYTTSQDAFLGVTLEIVSYENATTEWKDLLISYSDGSSTYTNTYDPIGNPLTYMGYTMTWGNVRQLVEVKEGNTVVAEYTYDANGLRTSKTVDGVTYRYTYGNVGFLAIEKQDQAGNISYIDYLYNPDGSLLGFRYLKWGSTTLLIDNIYYCLTGHGGDVLAILDSTGRVMVYSKFRISTKVL